MADVGEKPLIITINPVFDIESGKLLSHDGVYEYSGPVMRFDRALANQAKSAADTASQTGSRLGASAQQIGSTLIPGLKNDYTNPPGYSPADLATMKQGSLEAAGGTAGALTGALANRSMRMRNPAGLSANTAAVAEGASRGAGSATQDILTQNAQLKERQKQSAQSGLEGLYGTDTSGMLHAMGLVPQDVEAGAKADSVGWLQNLTGILTSVGQMGKGFGAAAGG